MDKNIIKGFPKDLAYFLDWKRSIYLIIIFGFILRIFLLLLLSDFPLVDDALEYHKVAIQLLHNDSFYPYWPPGLSYFLSLVYKILGESEIIGRVSMLLFYIIFSLLIYLFVKEISNKKAANLTVLIFSLYPLYIHQSVDTLTHLPVATCLIGIAYLLTLTCKKTSKPLLFLIGLILGAVTLIRPSSMALTLLVPLFIFFKTKRIWISIIPFMISLIIISGWILKAYNMTGQFVMINYASSQNFFFGNNPYTPLYKTWWFGSHNAGGVNVPEEYTKMVQNIRRNPIHVHDKIYRKVAFSHILSRPDLFLIRTMNRARNYFAFDTCTGSFLINKYKISNKLFGLIILGIDAVFYNLIMIGAILFLFNFRSFLMKSDHFSIILGIVIVYAVPYWLSFSHTMYHIPIVPLFGIFASVFISHLIDNSKAFVFEPIILSNKRKYFMWLVLIIFIYIQIELMFVMYSRI
jgi:4-amino-4-deoxy-L-arabinose transferase-like glycosyltransferase